MSVLFWMGVSFAADPPDEAYSTLVKLVEDLFLQPELVDPRRLLVSAGRELEQEVSWLFVQEADEGLVVLHGGDVVLATLPWPAMDTLPATLSQLASVVKTAGYPLGDVDPELAVLSGVAEGLDRFSRVLADEKLDRFNVRLTGTLVGVGASFDARGDELAVTSVVDGGPAAEAGLHVGDVLLRVDGRSTMGMPSSEVSRRVRGEAGTQVRLQVRRAGVELAIAATRAEVVVANVVSKVLAGNVGYLAVDHISQRTVENLRAELQRLRDAGAVDQGLVLDLRGNTGGSMKESAWAADLFLEHGELLRTVGRDGGAVQNLQAEMTARDDGNEPAVPLVVLVDERTASGAEIMAGALLELDRAAIVGRRTYGKGTVQKIYDLDRDVRLKLTVARYLLANGRSISDGGIVPDVTAGRVIPLAQGLWYRGFDPREVGASFDRVVPEIVGEGPDDLPLELARRAVLGATGPERETVLASVRSVAAQLAAEQEAALTSLLAGRGISWEPAPPGSPSVRPRVTAEVVGERREGAKHVLKVRLTSKEPVDLFRVEVQLRSPSAGWWDGVVVPFGRVPAGATVEGLAEIEVPSGVEARVDAAEALLRADKRPQLALGEHLLPSASAPPPTLRLTARLEPDLVGAVGPNQQPVSHVVVLVQDLAKEALQGVEVHLGYPQCEGVELLDWGVRLGEVPGRSERRVSLALEAGPGAPSRIPLSVTVADDQHGAIVEWPLSLPSDGSPVTLQAPTLEVGPLPTRSLPGRMPVELIALDDRQVEDVVVTVNGRKVAWSEGGHNREELLPAVELRTGENRITATVRDDQGLRVRRTVVVYGDGPEAVSADEELPAPHQE